MKRCIDCSNFFENNHTKRNDCNFPDIEREISMNMAVHLEDAEYEVIRWLREADDENRCPKFTAK
ncbi:hypothetical protein ACFL4Q_04025 [candidate division KSB1 bacterium]